MEIDSINTDVCQVEHIINCPKRNSKHIADVMSSLSLMENKISLSRALITSSRAIEPHTKPNLFRLPNSRCRLGEQVEPMEAVHHVVVN